MLAYKSGWGEIFERGVRLPPYVTHQEEVPWRLAPISRNSAPSRPTEMFVPLRRAQKLPETLEE
jgi:hypothetical protein